MQYLVQGYSLFFDNNMYDPIQSPLYQNPFFESLELATKAFDTVIHHLLSSTQVQDEDLVISTLPNHWTNMPWFGFHCENKQDLL